MIEAQQTLVIVKPDGIAKGLVGQILCDIAFNELKVLDSIRIKLDKKWVQALYQGEENEVYYKDVINWMTSGHVLLLKIKGLSAVDIVKWQIIGRYPNGIRGKYADNWIQNVAHAPDSENSAHRELNLTNSIFKRSISMREKLYKNKTIFALTGMSECGKSTVGKYFDSIGIPRLKIVKLFERIRDKKSPGENLYEFTGREEKKDPCSLWDLFIAELLEEMNRLNVDMVSIESLYGGGLGPYLKQKLAHHFCLVYIDIPLEVRLKRQVVRENLVSIEKAKKIMLPRDKVKKESGIPDLKKIADIIIDNSGALQDLYGQLDALINEYK